MKKVLLGTTALLGVGTIAGAAQASDGIKLDVGGFFNVVYQGIFDHKGSHADFGRQHNYDRFINNSEVHFKGETTLDNGLTVGAHIELEGLDAGIGATGGHGQIDESYIYWSGGFGQVKIGSQNGAIGDYCLLPPGATANFSAWSPGSWGSNDPIGSNTECADTEGHAQKIVYITPNFSGFQLRVSYTPSNAATRDAQPGVNGHGSNVNGDGTAHHSFSAYATYNFAGDGWGVDWGGGGSWQTQFNPTKHGHDGASNMYQTDLNVSIGNFAVGGVFTYDNVGDNDNNFYTVGGGISYGVDAWTVGLQGSHGHYNGAGNGFATDPGGHVTLNRIIATGSYAMGPGVTLDAEVGYTWFNDTGTANNANNTPYHAVDVAIGSAFTF
jgi:hypothetical protein